MPWISKQRINFFPPSLLMTLWKSITMESIMCSVQKNPDRPDTFTTIEIRQYFRILIFMSIFRYPNIRSYWWTKFGFFFHISETMALNRFEKIRNFIHFNDIDKHLPTDHPDHGNLHKLRLVIQHLNERFCSILFKQRLSINDIIYVCTA